MGGRERRDEPGKARPSPIVSMSFRLAIPWRVALQQSPPPLHQPTTILDNKRWFEKGKISERQV